MSETRILTKYPNRRLYDRREHTYIRLDHVREMIKDGEDIVVRERFGDRDITRAILMQALVDLEESGTRMLSKELLTQLIWCHGALGPDAVALYLDECMRLFVSDANPASAAADASA
jgi:polyhydroxyalkanoate synthesis repressor PhaR